MYTFFLCDLIRGKDMRRYRVRMDTALGICPPQPLDHMLISICAAYMVFVKAVQAEQISRITDFTLAGTRLGLARNSLTKLQIGVGVSMI